MPDSSEFHGEEIGAAPRILVVEDNFANQLVTMTILKKRGYDVVCAANGLEALAHLEASRFDLVLMDVSMPVMDGLEATRKIRQLPNFDAKPPIIALTAHNQTEDQVKCLACGMDDFLTKPATGEALVAKIKAWL